MNKNKKRGHLSKGTKGVISHLIDEIVKTHSHRRCVEIIGGGLKETLIIVRRVTRSIKRHKRLAFKVMLFTARLIRKPGGEFKKVCHLDQLKMTRRTSALQPA
jgi:hypothetical protein